MRKSCIIAFVTVFIFGAYTQNITFQYKLKNVFVAPNFQLSQDITLPGGQPFIRAMERAADKDKAYEFAVHYYGDFGYLVTEVHGLASAYSRDKTCWEIYNGTTLVMNAGVSSYIPSSGDVVTLNFTADANC